MLGASPRQQPSGCSMLTQSAPDSSARAAGWHSPMTHRLCTVRLAYFLFLQLRTLLQGVTASLRRFLLEFLGKHRDLGALPYKTPGNQNFSSSPPLFNHSTTPVSPPPPHPIPSPYTQHQSKQTGGLRKRGRERGKERGKPEEKRREEERGPALTL